MMVLFTIIALLTLTGVIVALLVYIFKLKATIFLSAERLELQRQLFAGREMAQEKAQQDKFSLLKEEFKSISSQILDERAIALKSANNEQLNAIISPLKEKLGEFKFAVDEAKNKGIEINSSMKTQLEKMVEATQKLGSDANNLASALKGQSKVQGNWGEMILDDILSGAGLTKGVHYDVQETLRHDDGSRVCSDQAYSFRPDVIVHYPDGKDVIIDSKVSLSAYIDYVNSSNDADRSGALTRHLRSVRSHVDALARKDYAGVFSSKSREAVDLVFMFVPNEPSYLLMLESDPQLWQSAFERKVVIVSPLSLMALLQIIKIAWTRFDQERNQKQILETAGQLLERLYGFYESFDKVGKELESANGVYQDAIQRLKGGDGKHSVIRSGEKLKELGVKIKKARQMPERLSDSDMELLEEQEQASEVTN